MLRKAELKFVQTCLLSDTQLTADGAQQVAQNRWLYLKMISFDDNQLGNKGLKYVVQHSEWPRLEILQL
jgi:hypothetical protein